MKPISITAFCLMLLGMIDTTIVLAEQSEWNQKVIRGKSCRLECNDLRRNGTYDDMQAISWIFPDKTVHMDGYSDGNVLVKGKTVSISSLNESLEGIYHCQYDITNGTERVPQIVKRGINYGGPAYETRLDEYAMNLLAGFVAVIVLLISTTVLCLASKFYSRRHVAPGEEDGGKTGTSYGSDQETNVDEHRHRDSVRPQQFRKASEVLGETNLPQETKGDDICVDNPGFNIFDEQQMNGESIHPKALETPTTGEQSQVEIIQPEELGKLSDSIEEKRLSKPAVLEVTSL